MFTPLRFQCEQPESPQIDVPLISADSDLEGLDYGQKDTMSPNAEPQSSQGNQVEMTKAQQAHSNLAGGIVIANAKKRFYPLLLNELSRRYGEIRYASWGWVGSHQGIYKGSLIFIVSLFGELSCKPTAN
jgi:hypothetical protein